MTTSSASNVRKARVLCRSLGIAAVLMGIAFLVLVGPLFDQFLAFAEAHLSTDGQITPEGARFARQELVVIGIVSLVAGTVAAAFAPSVIRTARRLTEVGRSLSNDMLGGGRWSTALFAISLALSVLLPMLWFLQLTGVSGNALQSVYGEDRLLENLTAIFFVVAGLILLWKAVSLKPSAATRRIAPRVILVGIALAFVFFGMEEISWGQRLFDWETPAFLATANEQGETNIHNLSNRLNTIAYRPGALAFVVLVCMSWRALSRRAGTLLASISPPPALAPLIAAILAFGAVLLQKELLEQLGAAFALCYAVGMR